MNTLFDDLNNLEFRVLIYSCGFKLPQKTISKRLNLHISEINKMLKDIKKLEEYERLKDEILEACFCNG